MADSKTPLMSRPDRPELPSYNSFRNDAGQQRLPAGVTYVPVPVYQHANSANRPSPRRRFFRALVIGFAIWIGLSFLIPATGRLLSRHFDYFERNRFPVPSTVSIVECGSDGALTIDDNRHVKSYHMASSEKTSFSLPLESEQLMFLSKGAYQQGKVEITTSPSVEDTAEVEVTAYYKDSFYNSVRVCRVEGRDGEAGVGIFTPRRWHWSRHHPHGHDDLYFSVLVTLPQNSARTPLLLKKLDLEFSNYKIDFGDLKDSVAFDRLDVSTSNGHVNAMSLYADHALIRSSNGAIEGYYNTSGSLTLHTSNAPITVEADLNHDGGYSRPTSINMITSNNQIAATLNLHSSKSEKGRFRVMSKSSNGPLDIKVPKAPVSSDVNFMAQTTNAFAEATLPSTYEGSFSLSTSNADTKIDYENDIEDPAGRGRRRSVDVRHVGKGLTAGNVYWEEAGTSRGSVVVKSTNKGIVFTV